MGRVRPRPLPHLPGVGAAGVDHVLAGDVALLGEDLPLAAVELLDVRCPAAADDARAQLPRPGRQRLGNAAGVDVAIVGGVQRADHAFEVVEGVEFGDPVRADQLDVEAQRAPDRQRMAQPVHLVLAVRQPERATAVPRDRLPGLGLQRPGIEPDVVVHALAQRERAGGVGDLPRRVPCRTRRQLGLLQQDNVGPALVREVVGQPAAHDAAADDDHTGAGGKGLLGGLGHGAVLRFWGTLQPAIRYSCTLLRLKKDFCTRIATSARKNQAGREAASWRLIPLATPQSSPCSSSTLRATRKHSSDCGTPQ